MVTRVQAPSSSAADALPAIHQLDRKDLDWALAEGWRDFRDKRGDILLVGLLYPVICIVAALVTFNGSLYLFFPLAAGVSIAGPAVASGFYELARRREEGRDSTWRHFFDPLRDDRRTALLVLTTVLIALFAAWMLVAYALYGWTFVAGMGEERVPSIPDFLRRVFTTPEGWRLIVLGNLAGFVFAVVTLVISVASFPMAVDRTVDAGTALRTSVAVARANPGAVASWGFRVAALLALGTLPFGVGLALVLPWLGYATWHLYTRAVAR